MNRYYIKFVSFRNYVLIDRYHNSVIVRGSLDMVNSKANELKDVDDYIEY